MSDIKSGRKTMLMSVIMSSPGPLVVGLGLLVGQSSTQVADFVRRSIELLAIILSFVIFCITTRDGGVDVAKKERYEKGTNVFVSVAMIVSGIIMLILAITAESTEKGNVIPGLTIATLGLVANSIFWVKYSRLAKASGNKILTVQSNLYRAKTFVDFSVFLALGVVLFSDNVSVSYYFDMIGTVCVSVYLVFTGVKTLIAEMRIKSTN